MTTILALPKGGRDIASSRHRVHDLLAELEPLGWSTATLTPSMRRERRGGALVRDLRAAARSHDVVLVQRPGRRREERLVLELAFRRARLVVLDVDDPVDERGVFGWALTRADVLLAGSRAVLARYGSRVDTAALVPTPLDVGAYLAAAAPAGGARPVAGFLGDAAAYAGSLERMLGRLAAPWSARVVGTHGEPGLEARLRAACAVPLELVGDIAWTDEAAVATAIAGFDLGLAPFRDAEGGSYKTVQYMAAGAVPLVEAGGEAAHHVRAALGDGAAIVDPGDATAMAAALARLADPAARVPLRAAGLAAVARYDRRAVAAEVDGLLRSALAGSA